MLRYMVFTWSEYDNPDPFDCLDKTFDDLSEAKEYADKVGEHTDDGFKLFCIFDRVDGSFIQI